MRMKLYDEVLFRESTKDGTVTVELIGSVNKDMKAILDDECVRVTIREENSVTVFWLDFDHARSLWWVISRALECYRSNV